MAPFTIRVAVLLLTGATLTAHPGDSSYWLIEVGDHIIRSSILLPDHFLVNLPSPDLDPNGDGIVDQQELVRSGDEIAVILRDHLVLEADPALERTRPDEFHLESGGFLEVVTTYARTPQASSLKALSLLDRLGSNGHTTLCRVIGGVPERFTLETQRNSAEIVLPAMESGHKQPGTQAIVWRRFLRPAIYTFLFLVVLGLAALSIRKRFG